MSTPSDLQSRVRQRINKSLLRDIASVLLKSRFEFIKPDLALSRWLLVLTGALAAAILSQAETAALWFGAGWLLSIVVILIVAGIAGVIAFFLEGRITAAVSILTTINSVYSEMSEHFRNTGEVLQQIPPTSDITDDQCGTWSIRDVATWLDYPDTWFAEKFLRGQNTDSGLPSQYKNVARTIYHHAMVSRLQLFLIVLIFGIALVDIAQQQVRTLLAEPLKTEQPTKTPAHPQENLAPKSGPTKQ